MALESTMGLPQSPFNFVIFLSQWLAVHNVFPSAMLFLLITYACSELFVDSHGLEEPQMVLL